MKRVLQLAQLWFARWQSWPLPLRILFVGFILLQTLLFFFARLPEIKVNQASQKQPFLKFVPLQEEDQYDATTEQAILFDSAPIFIPTRWNAAQQKPSESVVTIPVVFKEFEPSIELIAAMSGGTALEAGMDLVQSPADLLRPRFEAIFKRQVELPDTMEPYPDARPTAYYRGLDGDWTRLSALPGIEAVSILTNPVTFYVNISASRELPAPARQASESGLVDFDRAVRGWLNSPEVLAQLPVGYSEVVVYP
ncbi:MAG: hypothetical protein GWO81_07550 [Verrucomicrobia bacterium]|nr:hypothetical protein [Verrucomicrobiota bacterium]